MEVSLLRSKEDIISEALLIQIDKEAIRADFFTSTDILTVVDIGRKEVERVKKLYMEKMDFQEILKSIRVN